jgi:hypothetical protein
VFATDLGQSNPRCCAFFDAENEVAGFLLGVAAALLLIVASEAGNLPRSGKKAGVEIEGGDTEFAVFDAAVGTLGV